MATAFIGIGSNIQPEANVAACKTLLLKHWPAIKFSSLYSSAPREYENQNQFFNAVASVETEESPEEVVQVLREIETTLKKSPPFKFGPRTIDLDLLLFGNAVIEREELSVPHPRMHERRFVLEPLCELLNPQAIHPTLRQSWAKLLKRTKDQECTRVEETR